MSKIVVIDSLARSGTTLLSSIMHSQIDISAYRGVFHEPLACNYGQWACGLVCQPIFPIETAHSICKQNSFVEACKSWFSFEEHLKISWEDMKKNSQRTLNNRNQLCDKNRKAWEDVFKTHPRTLGELDSKYQELAGRLNSQILCFRWNQGSSYYLKWLRNPNHYWVTICRRPESRACSAKKSHNWSWENSLKCSKWFAQNTRMAIAHEKVHLLYYEDLVLDPKAVLKKLFNFLDYKTDHIEIENLIHQDGTQYKSETVDNMKDGKSHKDGKVTKGIYSHVVDRYKTEMPEHIKTEFVRELSNEDIYKRYFQL